MCGEQCGGEPVSRYVLPEGEQDGDADGKRTSKIKIFFYEICL